MNDAQHCDHFKGLSHEISKIYRDAAGVQIFGGSDDFNNAKSAFIAINASLRGLSIVSCLFLSFLLITRVV